VPKKDFNVVIVHGHSKEWKKLKSYVKEAGFTPRILMEEYRAGVIFNRWRDTVWDEVHCAVILMTKDDKVAAGTHRARQNVVFELGYCFGAFDSLDENGGYTAEDAIIVLAEEGVERFADIEGLTTIQFKGGRLGRRKGTIKAALVAAYELAQNFYGEL
jgi:predicted nucleotide-binding protein